jgi:LysR family transcriptional regulator, transcriptional activator for dmlA
MDKSGRLNMFVKVADSGSFTAAAAMLGLTPSAVSRAIGDLERSLGVRLLNRTTRQLRLSQEGEQVYRRARDILDRLTELESSVARTRRNVSGTVRVGITPTLSRYVVMPRLDRLLSRHPELQLEFRDVTHGRGLQSENLDIALVAGELPDSRLLFRRLGQGRPAVYASEAYVARRGEPEHPADLERHRCLVFHPYWLTQPVDEWTFERDGVRTSVHVKPAVLSADREALITAAMSGAGLILMACFDPSLAASGQLRRLLLPWRCPDSYHVYALYRRAAPPPRVAAVLAFIEECFAAFDPEQITFARPAGVSTSRGSGGLHQR